MSLLLSCQQLSIQIEQRLLCDRLNLTIKAGERWAILGKNGAGKSTLLHTLAGLRSPSQGEVLLGDKPLAGIPRNLVARQLGVLLQDQASDFPGTVLEQVMMGRHPHLSRWQWEGDDDHALAMEALEAMELSSFVSRQIGTLSGGERQRLAIATLLCQQAPLLLLDEPANHLDIHQQIAVLNLLCDSKQSSRAVLMVIHDINLALRYCDHFLLLFDNGEHLSGPAEQVINEPNLSRLYQHPVIQLPGPQHPLYLPA